MKVCVINGSPKGDYSITLQTVLYIQKHFPDVSFKILNVGQRIRSYERDMSEAFEAIKQSELILFSYPVYTFIAPSQLHRFIELAREAGCDLSGKYVTQITTSKHFYDVTAHRYIEENCADMGGHVIHGLSADMDDLLTPEGRADANKFFSYVLFCMENGIYENIPVKIDAPRSTYIKSLEPQPKSDKYDTVILTNKKDDDVSLDNMIEDFIAVYPYPVRIINIAQYPFAGGCISCFNCAGDGKCIYKDGFDSFLREKIQCADAIVFAFTIKDHTMGADFKVYDDRQFCNGHRTVTMGMPMGYIINGDYQNEQNLRTVIEARCEVGHNFLAGAACSSDEIAAMSSRLTYALKHKYVQPQNFYGVGGMKIFRDLIYVMRGLMRADHKFYKKHGIYDFPQKKVGTILKIKLVGMLFNNPKIKAKMGNKINTGMIAPYKKAIDSDK